MHVHTVIIKCPIHQNSCKLVTRAGSVDQHDIIMMLIYSHAYDKYQHHGIDKVMMVYPKMILRCY